MMQHTVLFIVKNSLLPRIGENIISRCGLSYTDAGIESHILMGLRQTAYFQPDIIFLDSDLPYMGVCEYLTMLSGVCSRFSVLLYRETTYSSTADDPHIVMEIGPEDLTPNALRTALCRAAEASEHADSLSTASTHSVSVSGKALFSWLERADQSSELTPAAFFSLQLLERLQIITLVPDQFLVRALDTAALTNYILPQLQNQPNTYFSVLNGNCMCVISPQKDMQKHVLSLLSAAYGKSHFYYAVVTVDSLSTLLSSYQLAKQILRLAYFEPEDYCLNNETSGIEVPFDFDSALITLLEAVITGNSGGIITQIDLMYRNYLRSTRSLAARERLRNYMKTIHLICAEFCAADIHPILTPCNEYLTQEADDLERLFLYLSASIAPHFNQLSPYVIAALYYIHSYYGEDLTLISIARRINISHPYLSTLFKNALHITLKEYLTNIRITKAEYLLCHTSLKISDIAVKVGLQDPRYFSRMFRKYHSVTPSEFRSAAEKEVL